MDARQWFQSRTLTVARGRTSKRVVFTSRAGCRTQRKLAAETLERRELLAADMFGPYAGGVVADTQGGYGVAECSSPNPSELRIQQTRAGTASRAGANTAGTRVRTLQSGRDADGTRERVRGADVDNGPIGTGDAPVRRHNRAADGPLDEGHTRTRARTDQALREPADRLAARRRDRLVKRDANTQPQTDRIQQAIRQRNRDGDGPECRIDHPAGNSADDTVAASPLSEIEMDGLFKMREEEKLARDVYIALGDKWDTPVFSNIAQAETRHMEAVGGLLDKYGLDDPVVDDTPGQFSAEEFSGLYADLVQRGSASLVEAYRVGALIEEMDIADLQHALSETTHTDVQNVYENLMRGSRNHLRAFAAQLETVGATYDAQFLSQEQFDAIAESPMEAGNGQRGDTRMGNDDRGDRTGDQSRRSNSARARAHDGVFTQLGQTDRGGKR